MSTGWEGNGAPQADSEGRNQAAEAPIIATYRAVVGLGLERSSLEVSAAPEDARAFSGLESAPEWSATPWAEMRERAQRQETVPDRLTVLALGKLKALVDFGAHIPDGSSEEIRDAIDEHWPGIAGARRDAAAGKGASPYARVQVEAVVRANGATGWGYELGPRGSTLPGLNPDATAVDGFDRYLQNVIRADLAGRLASFS